MNIGKRIAEYRATNNITQNQLATSLNVTRQAVSKWETNNSIPDIETLHSLANLMGTTIDELLYQKESNQTLIPIGYRSKKAIRHSIFAIIACFVFVIFGIYDLCLSIDNIAIIVYVILFIILGSVQIYNLCNQLSYPEVIISYNDEGLIIHYRKRDKLIRFESINDCSIKFTQNRLFTFTYGTLLIKLESSIVIEVNYLEDLDNLKSEIIKLVSVYKYINKINQ